MSDYLDFLDQMATKYGVPPEEARAIYENETRSGKIVRNSPAGAIGHMQLMPGTARELGVNPNDPYQNIEGGVRYYAQQRKRFGDPALAAAAYNAGPGRVGRLNRVPNIPETRDYVSRFLTQIGRVKPSQSAPASATVAPEQAPQGPMTMTPQQGALSTAGGADEGVDVNAERMALYKQLAAAPEEEAARYRAQFEQGQQRINEMYGGPSQSQMLFALSKALLSPRRYKGFGGTMHNVSQALGGIAEQGQEARQRREAALARLQESYDDRIAGTRTAAMNARIKLLDMQAEDQAAAAKAAQPRVEMTDAGELVEVPKQVAKPMSRAEYDALPVGTYYIVPSGPQAGKVVRKNAP